MRKIIVILVLFIFCCLNVFASNYYKKAKKFDLEGYYDNILQEDVYEVRYAGYIRQGLITAKSYCMLRSAEVCLESGYKTFDIIFNDSFMLSVDTVGVFFNIKCYKDDTGIYKASQIKENLYKEFGLNKNK